MSRWGCLSVAVLTVAAGMGNAATAGDWLRPDVTVYGPLEPRFHYSGRPTTSAQSPLSTVGPRGQGYHSGDLDYPCEICPVWLGYYGPRPYCSNVTVPWAPGGFFGCSDTFEPVLRYQPAPHDASLTTSSTDGTPVPVAQARSLLPPRRTSQGTAAPAPLPVTPAQPGSPTPAE